MRVTSESTPPGAAVPALKSFLLKRLHNLLYVQASEQLYCIWQADNCSVGILSWTLLLCELQKHRRRRQDRRAGRDSNLDFSSAKNQQLETPPPFPSLLPKRARGVLNFATRFLPFSKKHTVSLRVVLRYFFPRPCVGSGHCQVSVAFALEEGPVEQWVALDKLNAHSNKLHVAPTYL